MSSFSRLKPTGQRCRRGGTGEAPGAVVLGGHINGLGLVRSLAARGVPAAVICTTTDDITQHSRWVCANETVLGIDERPDLLFDLLLRRAIDWRGWALLPANDGALATLAKYKEELSAHYTVIAPGWEETQVLLDKERMLAAARAVGILVPADYGAAAEALAGLQELRFPVIVKPSEGHRFRARFGCKLLQARNRTELAAHLSAVRQAGLECRVFDVVPGPDSNIYAYCTYVDATGEPARGVTIRKLRQSPPFFGVARVAEVVEDIPELREATIELLRRLRFRGIAAAEFKRDARDGTFRFMEVNGRSVIYNALLRKAGLDLTALAWADYVLGAKIHGGPTGWPGVWVNLHADLLYSAWNHRQENLQFTEFLHPYRRPVIDAVWSAADPLPFLTQWGRTAGAVVRGLALGRPREPVNRPAGP